MAETKFQTVIVAPYDGDMFYIAKPPNDQEIKRFCHYEMLAEQDLVFSLGDLVRIDEKTGCIVHV